MRPQFTFRQYRAMDLTMLTLILVFCEWLIVRASTRWFPGELYVLSVTPVVTAVVMIRWGAFAVVPAPESRVFDLLDQAYGLFDTTPAPRDGYYAFVCEKCAPVFSHYGYFLAASDLTERAERLYAAGGDAR